MSRNGAGYDPMTAPLALPIRVVRATLHFERPYDLPEVAAATLGTSLRGALGHAIRQTTCPAMRACRAGPEGCAGAPGCAVPVLWAPESLVQKRQHGSPMVLAAPARVPRGESEVRVRVTLWGRGALDRQRLAWAALRAAGGRGLDGPNGVLRFETDLDVEHDGTLAEWAESRAGGARTATFRFAARRGGPSEPARAAHRIAEAAHDLVQWDLFDRALDDELGKRGCDDLADRARDGVRDLLAEARVDDRAVIETAGRRHSGRNAGEFDIARLSGDVVIEGDLEALAPWLALVELRGLGPKRAFAVPPEVEWG